MASQPACNTILLPRHIMHCQPNSRKFLLLKTHNKT